MPLNWLALEAQVEGALHATLGEAVLVEPMKRADFRGPVVDGDRLGFRGRAVLRLPEPYAASVDGASQRIAYSEASLDIELARLPDGWRFLKNDRVTALDRPGRPVWLVSRVETGWGAFIRLTLSPISEAET